MKRQRILGPIALHMDEEEVAMGMVDAETWALRRAETFMDDANLMPPLVIQFRMMRWKANTPEHIETISVTISSVPGGLGRWDFEVTRRPPLFIFGMSV